MCRSPRHILQARWRDAEWWPNPEGQLMLLSPHVGDSKSSSQWQSCDIRMPCGSLKEPVLLCNRERWQLERTDCWTQVIPKHAGCPTCQGVPRPLHKLGSAQTTTCHISATPLKHTVSPNFSSTKGRYFYVWGNWDLVSGTRESLDSLNDLEKRMQLQVLGRPVLPIWTYWIIPLY